MPQFTAVQTAPATTQAARITPAIGLSASQPVPPATQVAEVAVEHWPDLQVSGDQTVPHPTQRARLTLAQWRGPAEPRPPGVPAVPRP